MFLLILERQGDRNTDVKEKAMDQLPPIHTLISTLTKDQTWYRGMCPDLKSNP